MNNEQTNVSREEREGGEGEQATRSIHGTGSSGVLANRRGCVPPTSDFGATGRGRAHFVRGFRGVMISTEANRSVGCDRLISKHTGKQAGCDFQNDKRTV